MLNLWLKNSVFAPDVLNPLFDLCNPNRPNADLNGSGVSMDLSSPPMMMDDNTNHSNNSGNDGGGASGGVKMGSNQLDSNTIRQLQQLQQILIRQTGGPSDSGGGGGGGFGQPGASSSSMMMSGGGGGHQDGVKFNRKLLDFDYGDDDNGGQDDDPSGSKSNQMHGNNAPLGPSSSSVLDGNNISQLLQDPNVLRQLQTLQKLNNQNEMEEKQTKLVEMRLQEEAFEKHLAKVLTKLPFANECDLSRQHVDLATFAGGGQLALNVANTSLMGGGMMDNSTNDPEVEFIGASNSKMEIINLDGNDSRSPTPDRDRYKRRSRNSRSRSRDRGRGRRRGSRSRSRSRSPRRRRNSSRDRERGSRSDHRSARSEKAAAEKERDAYERERRRKGLPDIRKEHLSVCSTTLWVGHLSKLVQQEELSDTFGKFGDIVSIDMIVPRGCAFIAMNRRQDAYRAMSDLKHHKMHGRVITISWATGKGVKSKEWKDYWEVDLGVSYIPWGKLMSSTDFEALEEGGMFDEDSMPDWLKAHVEQAAGKKTDGSLDMSSAVAAAAAAAAHLFDASNPPPGGSLLPAGVPLVAPPFGIPPVARLLPPPMGLPMGLAMGVPPPPMMLPLGLPGLDKAASQRPASGPGDFLQMFQMAGMNAAVGAGALKPPPMSQNNGADDHMDIENDEEEEAAAAVAAAGVMDPAKAAAMMGGDQMMALRNFFNRPPPLMGAPPGGVIAGVAGGMPPAPMIDSIGGGGMMGGGSRARLDDGRPRGRDERDFDGDRGRWSSNGGGAEFNRRGRGGFNNGGMFNERRDNGADFDAYDRIRDGE